MAKTSVTRRRKAKPSRAATKNQHSTHLLSQTALLLGLSAKTILSMSVEEAEIHTIVQAARQNLEKHIQEAAHNKVDDDDRPFQALGILVLLDRAISADLDLGGTSLVDPLRNALEAAQVLLEGAAGADLTSARRVAREEAA